MKYLVEIDDQTSKGAQLISYIEKLKAPKKAVIVRKERALTDDEMILPGPKPSKAQLEAWLEPDEDEEEMLLSEAIAEIKKELTSKSKARKKK
jgi:hypothetical protein